MRKLAEVSTISEGHYANVQSNDKYEFRQDGFKMHVFEYTTWN